MSRQRQAIELVDGDLGMRIAEADDATRRRGLAAAVRLALARVALQDDRLDRAHRALEAGILGDCPERTAVLALVEELDTAA